MANEYCSVNKLANDVIKGADYYLQSSSFMEHSAKSSAEVTASSGSSEIVSSGLGVGTTTTEEHSQGILVPV